MSAEYTDDRYQIERAAPWHVRFLPGIELQAARLFDGHDVPAAVLAESTDEEDFHRSQQAGLLWVAVSSGGEPVGFARVEPHGRAAHLEEIDVHPNHGRRGLGSALVRAVCHWARDHAMHEVTLTTFRDVPWNAPLYARLGFSEMDADSLTPELEEIVRDETARGLAPERRVVMRYVVPRVADSLS